MGEIGLRPVRDADLDALYDQMRDPEAVMMAAFTAEDPDDREAFDAHFVRLRTSPDILLRAITVDGELAGTIASFVVGGDTEITYWLDRAWWGRGVATRAVELLLDLVPVRPIIARAASDNAGSLAVLRKTGFRPEGIEVAYSTARGKEIEETVLRLDGP
ncbi:GNAT family N-acetyltransferase [Amorphoplanes digitatis]|uniref:RimJ/RimL family protein N-acetyltransferase n=1 Tax=Actinoplanes digitatis TaxID=1868 RepID=A0A7W7MQ40_9ACTN|nr:GNAT family N-acetyltransferase [Actinoplanes digitatis]MBB4762200.1 RimJ/RimL family protein N-acetyltransferase [Actinoplanes digitatis]GID97768.1 N-acetyltransferase [Actinoplanes digitatis]